MYNIKVYDRSGTNLYKVLQQNLIEGSYNFSETVNFGQQEFNFSYYGDSFVENTLEGTVDLFKKRNIVEVYQDGTLIYTGWILSITEKQDKKGFRFVIKVSGLVSLLSKVKYTESTIVSNPTTAILNCISDVNTKLGLNIDVTKVQTYDDPYTWKIKNAGNCLDVLEQAMERTKDRYFFINEKREAIFQPYTDGADAEFIFGKDISSISIEEDVTSAINKVYIDRVFTTQKDISTDVESPGSDTITNGDFDYDGDWTKDTGWGINGGKAGASDVDELAGIYQPINMVVGQKYQVTYTISNWISGSVAYVAGGCSVILRDDNGTYTQTFTFTGGTDTGIYAGEDNTSLLIDNISVVEIITETETITVNDIDGGSVIVEDTESIAENGLLEKSLYLDQEVSSDSAATSYGEDYLSEQTINEYNTIQLEMPKEWAGLHPGDKITIRNTEISIKNDIIKKISYNKSGATIETKNYESLEQFLKFNS